MSQIYEPREDSFLLQKHVRKYAKGICLDVGTGSGIQALEALKKGSKVIAVDINKNIIDCLNKKYKNKKNIKFYQSDLFFALKKKSKFDTIIFNPPYLPEDARLKDLALDGGKKGYEILERFLNEADNYLKENGIILIVFSSLIGKEKINKFIFNNLLEYKELEKKHIFFEDLYVYLIRKSRLLIKLEKNKINNIKYFTKGHRGHILKGVYKNKEIIVKIKNPKSKAINRIQNEIKFLKIVNKKNIGPKLLFYDVDFFAYNYIKGDFILDCFQKTNKKNIIKILKGIFEQMFVLDSLKIDKEEMHHPIKHVIITKKDIPYLVDFERAHFVKKPHNVTQFCQFLISGKLTEILKEKNILINKEKMIELAKKYKDNMNKKNLNNVLKEIK